MQLLPPKLVWGLKAPFRSLAWSTRFYGWRGALFNVMSKSLKAVRVGHRVQHWLWQRMEKRFDVRFHVKTADWVPVEQLAISPARQATAVQYEPSSAVGLYRKLAGLGINHSNYSFVDIGSGKGRALLIASELPFSRVIGVEISELLHHIAKMNIASYRSRTQRCTQIKSVCADALSLDLPAEPTVFFMFNPFNEVLVADILKKVQNSVEQSPRHVVFVYSNPFHKHLMEKSGFLTKIGNDEHFWAMFEHRP